MKEPSALTNAIFCPDGTLIHPGIFLQFWEGVLGPFRLVKLARSIPKLGNL